MPERVQRKRTAGWRMPQGAVYVGRPSIYGNPWSDFRNRDLALALYEDMVKGIWSPGLVIGYDNDEVDRIYKQRHGWLRRLGPGHPTDAVRFDLAGRDLACWCPLEDEHGNRMPCHADVLLKIANSEVPGVH